MKYLLTIIIFMLLAVGYLLCDLTTDVIAIKKMVIETGNAEIQNIKYIDSMLLRMQALDTLRLDMNEIKEYFIKEQQQRLKRDEN